MHVGILSDTFGCLVTKWHLKHTQLKLLSDISLANVEDDHAVKRSETELITPSGYVRVGVRYVEF